MLLSALALALSPSSPLFAIRSFEIARQGAKEMMVPECRSDAGNGEKAARGGASQVSDLKGRERERQTRKGVGVF